MTAWYSCGELKSAAGSESYTSKDITGHAYIFIHSV